MNVTEIAYLGSSGPLVLVDPVILLVLDAVDGDGHDRRALRRLCPGRAWH